MPLEFGTDRRPLSERWCPAWPQNPDAPAKARFTRWIKKSTDEINWPNCVECGGPVTAQTGGRKTGDGFVHNPSKLVAGKYENACIDWLTAHPPPPTSRNLWEKDQ